MNKREEKEFTLTANSGQKIVRVEIINNGHGIRYYTVPKLKVQLQVGSEEFERMFPIVDIESVSLQDSFMQYEPKNWKEKRIKNNIIKAKEIGMKNFRKPCMDPSFSDDGETIIYCPGERPAVGKSRYWWERNALKFMPEKNSRLMDDLQKDVWLGILIKELAEDEGYEVAQAWKVVCVNSKTIGHFSDSTNVKYYFDMLTGKKKYDFEPTGSRKIGRWYDLGNTQKIVKGRKDEETFIFGGYYENWNSPLACAVATKYDYDNYKYGVGELVLDV